MIKNKLQITEEELLSEDGIFAARFDTVYDSLEKCCHCGYPILSGEEALELYSNGDIIHKDCWQEYADENIGAFGKNFVWSDDFNREL